MAMHHSSRILLSLVDEDKFVTVVQSSETTECLFLATKIWWSRTGGKHQIQIAL